MNFANVAAALEVPYYSLLTSSGSHKDSMFFYMKTKGEVEEGTKALGLKYLAIFRPALLTNRDNDFRLMEWIGSKVPFAPKCDAKFLG